MHRPQAVPKALALRYDVIVGTHEAKHLAGNFFDEIGIGILRPQQSDIALKAGSHSFEALDLKLQQS